MYFNSSKEERPVISQAAIPRCNWDHGASDIFQFGDFIPLGSSCSRAFHVLFASFFVFRLHYPQYLDKYFLFFEQVVFQIFEIRTEISILQPRIRKRFRGY